jgi:YebC/PmpR family DNA-binding regulatory protein
MSGHSKWAQIKRQKSAEDAKKSKLFGKLVGLIASESKRAKGDINSPGLRLAIERAKKENMPKDTIERAIKKGLGADAKELETLVYEAYGPGGVAMIIVVTTDNRNRAAQEIKHLLSKGGGSLAEPGAASWAFTKTETAWEANIPIALSDEDTDALVRLTDALEACEDVQEIFTNAE